ncbi:GGDEF domain-containing protein [Porticoccaceae bacterium]|nr:GGDEF domain-containing protein [Porticoccaceae bacterium]MDB9953353.1 GGDEF domain-containing protein [Porticoccaceae bacterium]MDB9999018.1 GGDEF domain-containing protein [Porticoccaceae bacterium]MDC0003057.1 GGDEF domain-containing protein [Porticoccaceae bacterium]
MAKVDNKDLVTGGFLSFSLMAQEIIATMFAFYSYRQGEMALATFYLAIAGVLLVALGIFYIFDRHNLARLLLAGTLLIGFFFLLLGASDASSLMWCLTIVPVIVGSFAYRQSLFMLIGIFAAATWIMTGGSMPFAVPNYSDIVVVRFLSAYAILAAFAVAMDNSRFDSLSKYQDLSSRVDQIAHQDQLTQLPNRNNMEGRLEKKYQQYRLINQPFSILLADLDNFKFINDRYGHDVGDDILYAIGQVLSEPLRGEDIVARWGGNEFMVLLPTANSEAAVNIAERLRAAASELDMDAQGDKLRISLSVGVASIDKCTGIDDLLSTAENGLYQAKHMGRDMVVVG